MRNLRTIFKRDLSAYFSTPVGYIYLIVFLLVSVGLYTIPFFGYPQADMRQFFMTLPIILSVLVPAVTMRVWAEERSENTMELLMTLPMSTGEIVAAKFLASFVFYLIALAGTLTIPAMLAHLGQPDPGAVIGGYLGAVLLGAFFLSIGVFISGLSKDQIVAFVISLLACFALFLLGTDFIAGYLDSMWRGLGGVLEDLVGVTGHYSNFTRGIIEIGDVLYFVAWTAIFLVLNGLFLSGRHRPHARAMFSTALVLCFGIGMAFNWILSGVSLERFDISQGKIYTISPATRKILSGLKVPVQVKLYVTPRDKMPTELRNLEQDIMDKLGDLSLASSGKLQFKAIHMEATRVLAAENEEEDPGKKADKEKSLESRLMEKGVRPFTVQARQKDKATTQLIYSSLGVAYKEKEEEIIPEVVPQTLPELEYRLVNTIFKITREKKPVIAMVAPVEAFNISPQLRQLYMQMGRQIPQTEDPYQMLQQALEYEKYEVRRVKLDRFEPLPEDYDALAVVEPRELNDRQLFEINRAISAGKPAFIAVQENTWNYSIKNDRIEPKRNGLNPNINKLLEGWGAEVDKNILMDVSSTSLTINDSSNPLGGVFGGGTTFDAPMHIVVNPKSMNTEAQITGRLSSIFYLWGSDLILDQKKLAENKLETTVLYSTSDKAWTVPSNRPLQEQDIEEPKETRKYPLAAIVKGQFPDVFAGRERPEWPDPQPGEAPPMREPPQEKPPMEIQPKPSRVILTGCAYQFRRNFLNQGSFDFYMNTMDTLALSEDLINVRSKKVIDRAIAAPSDSARIFWKFANLVMINLAVALAGGAVWLVRSRSRRVYNETHNPS